MGSGVSGLNKTSFGTSQPFAESYRVVPELLRLDRKDLDIYDPRTGYFMNPTATDLAEAFGTGRVCFRDGKEADGYAIYVLDPHGRLIIGRRRNPNQPGKRAPHPTLVGGRNPEVACAGRIKFEKGRILSVDHESGHFQPHEKSLRELGKYLKQLCETHPELFHENSPWRKGK